MIFGRENGPYVPFGVTGVAGAMAALLAVVGLALPTSLIESVAFQMYLDTVIASAVPPFGWLAKVAAALALGLVGGALGLGLARLFGVRSSDFGFANLLDRLRGVGVHDDDDAPVLRSADRHPDAPARRPFSAASDIPARHGPAAWDQYWVDLPDVDSDTGEDDDGELLLDGHFADAEPAFAGGSHDTAPYAEPSFDEDEYIADAPAPSVAAIGDEPVTETVKPAQPFVAEAPVPSSVPSGDPVDLSVARLDELLARLEAGLASRRLSQAITPATAMPLAPAPAPAAAAGDAVPLVPEASVHTAEPEPTFPQDAALAAALATLRRMNQNVG
ncbi:MAG: hypothetical protein ABL874_00610 [Sphingopyxis sp.]